MVAVNDYFAAKEVGRPDVTDPYDPHQLDAARIEQWRDDDLRLLAPSPTTP